MISQISLFEHQVIHLSLQRLEIVGFTIYFLSVSWKVIFVFNVRIIFLHFLS